MSAIQRYGIASAQKNYRRKLQLLAIEPKIYLVASDDDRPCAMICIPHSVPIENQHRSGERIRCTDEFLRRVNVNDTYVRHLVGSGAVSVRPGPKPTFMSHFNRRSAARQQRQLAKHVKKVDANHFFNLLTSPQLLDLVEVHLPEHRERKFPPTVALAMSISSVAGRSLDQSDWTPNKGVRGYLASSSEMMWGWMSMQRTAMVSPAERPSSVLPA
jgi:hypothetical protein